MYRFKSWGLQECYSDDNIKTIVFVRSPSELIYVSNDDQSILHLYLLQPHYQSM